MLELGNLKTVEEDVRITFNSVEELRNALVKEHPGLDRYADLE
jgi:hypothetical protein